MTGGVQGIAIIGGGFSGAMLAARLAERGVASTLIDRSGRFGPGLAYSSPLDDDHVLNVRSSRMSAVEGRPGDFVAWLKTHYSDQARPEGFAPRRLYGLYVEDRLTRVETAHPGRITRLAGEAVALKETTVRLADGRSVAADAVVLATGNPKPRTARGAGAGRVIDDPWAEGALDRIGPGDEILILGSGLTMVDMVLELAARGWRGRATALSRRGLKPLAHGEHHDAAVPPTPGLTAGPLSARLAEGRRLAAALGWRAVMEGLRPVTGRLWEAADIGVRGRFLRHLRPWWDVHRHRIAPGIAGALDALIGTGRLEIVAGRISGVEAVEAGVRLAWRSRGGLEQPPLTAAWLIDCTGPGHDPAADPLVGPLIAAGRARLDPSGLGLALDAEGRVLGRAGEADPRLFVLGPPARAAFWETVAVPDIRKRIERLADWLASGPV